MKLAEIHNKVTQTLGQNSKVIPYSCIARGSRDSALEVEVQDCTQMVIKDLHTKIKDGILEAEDLKHIGSMAHYGLTMILNGESIEVNIPFGYRVSKNQLEMDVSRHLDKAGKRIPSKVRTYVNDIPVDVKNVPHLVYNYLSTQLSTAKMSIDEIPGIAGLASIRVPYQHGGYHFLLDVNFEPKKSK